MKIVILCERIKWKIRNNNRKKKDIENNIKNINNNINTYITDVMRRKHTSCGGTSYVRVLRSTRAYASIHGKMKKIPMFEKK